MIKKFDSNISFLDSFDTIITYTPSFSNSEKKSIRVKKAIIKLPIKEAISSTDGFEIYSEITLNGTPKEELIEFFEQRNKNENLCIDITNELVTLLNSNENSFKIKIKNGQNISIDKVNSIVIVEYTSKRKKKKDTPVYEFNLNKAGNGSVDLTTGQLNITHFDMTNKKSSIPIEISHVYNSHSYDSDKEEIVCKDENKVLPSYNCGNGWKLNLEQYLVKEIEKDLAEDKETSKRFIYVDGEGNHHNLLEKYFYKNENGKKAYLKLNEITVDLEGNLSYEYFDGAINKKVVVEKEVISDTGLNLISDMEGFKDIEFLDKEIEEVANLKDQKEQLETNVNGLKNDIEYNKKQLVIYGLEKELFLIQNSRQRDIINLDTNNLELQEWVSKVQKQHMHSKRSYADDEEAKKYKTFDVETLQEIYNYEETPGSSSGGTTTLSLNANTSSATIESLRAIVSNESGLILTLGEDFSGNINGNLLIQKKSKDLEEKLYLESYDISKMTQKVKENIGIDYLVEENDISAVCGDILDEIAVEIGNWYDGVEQLSVGGENTPSTMSYVKTITLNTKNLMSIDAQIEHLIESIKQLHNQLVAYEEDLEKVNRNLSYIEKQIPIHYLSDGSGNTYGFGQTNYPNIYRLITINDTYGNNIYLKYEEGSFEKVNSEQIVEKVDFARLVSIINGEKEIFKLTYNEDNMLEKITSSTGKKVVYEYYKNKFLSTITYNKKVSKYNYNEDGRITSIIDPSGKGLEFNYENNKVKSLREISSTLTIKKDEEKKVEYVGVESDLTIDNKKYQTRNKIEFNYLDNRSTEVKDCNTEKYYTYIFDSLGNLTTSYENKFENGSIIGNTKVVTHDVDNTNNRRFKIESLSSPINFLDGINYDTYFNDTSSEHYLGDDIVCGDDIVLMALDIDVTDSEPCVLNNELKAYNKLTKTINVNNRLNEIINSGVTDFILSGWAEANSAYVDRRLTDYSDNGIVDTELKESSLEDLIKENMDNTQSNRRFELRAELTYEDGSTKEYYCTYDWMNTKWQYCALPITIEHENGSALKEIKAIFDYSFNTNGARFFGMSLSEGKWEYTEYNEDNLETYYENGLDDIIRISEYKDKILTCHKFNQAGEEYCVTYEYNNNNDLIRSFNESTNLVVENEYDDKGTLISSYKYHKNNPASRLYSLERKIDENGNVIEEYNELGEKVSEYQYVSDTCFVEKIKDKDVIAYGYDTDSDSINSITKTINNKSNTNIIQEDYGLITYLKHNDIGFEYEYDGFGKLTKIKVDENDYLDISYEKIPSNQLQEDGTVKEIIIGEKAIVDWGNEEKHIIYLNNKNNVTSVGYIKNGNEEITILKRQYDMNDNLIVETHIDGNIIRKYTYEYDKLNRLVNKVYTIGTSGNDGIADNEDDTVTETTQFSNVFENNVLKQYKFNVKNCSRSVNYEYDNKKKLESVQFAGGQTQTIEYDEFERIKKINNTANYTKEYDYYQKGNHASNLISSEYFIKNNIVQNTIEYKYDSYSNITDIYEDDELVCHYEYDEGLRLVRENNKKLNKTVIYSYDKGGNIEKKKEYTYSTLEEDKLLNGIDSIYKYNAAGYNDQLMVFNNEIFEYDKLGNPIVYRDTPLVWQKGKQLVKYGDNISYKYNINGIRTSKEMKISTDNGDVTTSTEYYYDGNKLVAQLFNNEQLMLFNYGVNGIEGFTYRGYEYHYKKNILGDIIAIVDDTNTEIVRYVYDAYGFHKTYYLNEGTFVDIETQTSYSIDKPQSYEVALENPFRYRGYYYDVETNLYYLISRYYDPQTGRFISMDSVEYLNPNGINGLNLYSYCGNNPIKNRDPNGNAFFTALLIAIGVGLFAGVATQATTDLIQSVKNNELTFSSWQTYVGAGLGGAIGGAMFAFGLGGILSGAISGAVSSLVGNGLEMATGVQEADAGKLIKDAFFESIIGGIAGSLINIPGINSGSHSMQQVFKSGISKVWKHNFSMSGKVVAKGFGVQYITSYASVIYTLIKKLFE